MPESKRLGTLSGKWVNKYIADDLNQIVRARTQVEQMMRQVVGEWKFSKVILNPATHSRNILSNLILAHAGGLPMYRLDIYTRALIEVVRGGELFQEARKAGMSGRTTFAGAEFESMVDAWNITKGSPLDRFSDFARLMKEGKGSDALQRIRFSQTKFGQKLGRIYQAEEQWFKMAKVMHNLEKGMKMRPAVRDAQDWLFDYTEVPEFIEWTRQSPVGAPFITFTYKALPKMMESAIVAPWRLLSVVATLYYLNDAAAKALGITDTQLEGIEKVLPEHMKGGFAGTPKFLLLPWRDKYGQLQYLDLTYILPWGDIGETGGLGRELMEKTPGLRHVAGLSRQLPLVGSPLMQAIGELGLNKSSFTRKNIYNSFDTAKERFQKISLYLHRQLAPSLAPGGYGWTRIQKALTSKPDYFGRTTDLRSAIASTLFGLKITPIDVRQQKRFRRFERNREVRDIGGAIARIRRNRGLTREEKRVEMRKLRAKQREVRRGGRGPSLPTAPRSRDIFDTVAKEANP
jgi:hypothetical protein